MTGHIFIYGEIGSQVTAKSVQDQIDLNYEDYEVHISSPGGNVYEGYAIYGILNSLSKPVTVRIEGLCASIATLIACVGDTVIMMNPAEFMIHLPHVETRGDSSDLRSTADQLDRIKDTIISVYKKKTKLSEAELSEMMSQETWMKADEAKQRGFVDEVQEKLKAVAYIDTTKIKMEAEKNKLAQILDKGLAEIKALLNVKEFKNMALLTLEDGTKVNVSTESEQPTPEELVGATITLEDGTPAPDGEHKMADGTVIQVAGGVIESAVMPPPAEEEASPEEELKAKIAELEAKLAAKDGEVANKEAEIQVANKTINKFKASISDLETKYNEVKNLTMGDANPPKDAHDKKIQEEKPYDPMAEVWGSAFTSSRKN
jgi:ATP-dependent protease ClpP protease subunit